MSWANPTTTVVNDRVLPIEKMARIYPNESGCEIYRAGVNDIHTPMNWDNHKQTKIAYIDRRDGNVCATMKFEAKSEAGVFNLFNQIAHKFGFSDEPFLIIVADFPSSMLGFQANQFIAVRGGYYFLAARHPIAKARSYYENFIPKGSIKYA